ncbi:MAG: class I SAM-dependent methyltransferase [Planctomycetaceae bacterium]|nr:hypothetical protein [Planctomycetaceae bacterium]
MEKKHSTVWGRIKRAWRKRGPIGFVRLAWRNAVIYAKLPFNSKAIRRQHFDHSFDKQYGTDTTGFIPIGALTVPAEHEDHAREYLPSDTNIFRGILARVPIDHSQFTFIDFGSGKGRTLLLASDYPFKRIIGVEFAVEMHRVAVNNIAVYKSPTQKCACLESICTDATVYQLPDSPLVCYLYAPFDDVVLTKLLANLKRWAGDHRHDVYVLYLHCEHRRLFDQSPDWKLVDEKAYIGKEDGFAIYQLARS